MGFGRDFETERKLVEDEDMLYITKYSYVTYMILLRAGGSRVIRDIYITNTLLKD